MKENANLNIKIEKNDIVKENKDVDFKINENNFMKKNRSSNIELLRFFLAILVIAIHTFTNAYQNFFILCGAVDCFAIISGYFLCTSKDDLRILKFIPTIIFLEFFNLFFYTIVNFTTSHRILHDLKDWLRIIEFGATTWWFIWALLIVYILSPFLNAGMKKIGPHKAIILIFLIWGLFQLNEVLKQSYRSYWYGYDSPVILVYSYLTGAFLKLYGQNFLKNAKLVLLTSLPFLLTSLVMQIIKYIFYSNTDIMIFTSTNKAIFSLPIAIYLFAFFNLLPLKNYKFVNYLGSLSLFLFAFHDQFKDFIIFYENIFNLNFNFFESQSISVILSFLVAILLSYPYRQYERFNRRWIFLFSQWLSKKFKINEHNNTTKN